MDATRIGLMFSGQGSQRPGMGAPWRDTEAWAELEVLPRSVRDNVAYLLLDADEETLRRTDNAQLATAGLELIVLRELRTATTLLDRVVVAAGHSLGEYSALAAAGIYSTCDTAELVSKRGAAMLMSTKANPGTMLVLVGVDLATVEELTAGLRATGHDVWLANLNAPGQVVVSGSIDGVAALEVRAAAAEIKTIRIKVGGAFHTPLMASAAGVLATALEETPRSEGDFPVIANLDARPHTGAEDWVDILRRQMVSPVRWEESLRVMAYEYACDLLVEIGPGKTLSGMARRIDTSLPCLSLSKPSDIAQLVDDLDVTLAS
ncbi:MAG: hypothetical protein JWQ39_2071 [Glaciihabitans sp.]|nr:hypothetical protein [Glaciihabitans sp.]